LDFNDKDIAVLFMIIGFLGIFVQAVVLKFLNDAIGERYVLVLSFTLGCIYNLLVGTATEKSTIFIAICVSTFVGLAFPTISAIKANNVVRLQEASVLHGCLISSVTQCTLLSFATHRTNPNKDESKVHCTRYKL
jgi:fucose permease